MAGYRHHSVVPINDLITVLIRGFHPLEIVVAVIRGVWSHSVAFAIEEFTTRQAASLERRFERIHTEISIRRFVGSQIHDLYGSRIGGKKADADPGIAFLVEAVAFLVIKLCPTTLCPMNIGLAYGVNKHRV